MTPPQQAVRPTTVRAPIPRCRDGWADPDGIEHFRRCRSCGGVHPGDLAAEPLWRLQHWSSEVYGWPHAFHVTIPNRSPETLCAITWSVATQRPNRSWTPASRFTAEHRAIMRRDWGNQAASMATYVRFGTRMNLRAKFFVHHLADVDVDQAAVRAVETGCGWSYIFADGVVSWRPAPAG